MKKILVIVGLLVSGMAVNAQVYLGGSFNFDFKTTQYESGRESTSSLDFAVLPDIGFYLGSKFNLGAEVGFGVKSSSSSDETTVTVVLVPYARLSVFQAGNFEVLAKGSLNTQFNKDYTYVGIHVDPILAYNVNNHITLQASLKFLSLRTYYSENKNSNSTVGMKIGLDANNVASLGGLNFGFIYKF